MISHKYQCIFIHIPKCAGTSIEAALGHFDQYEGRRAQDHRTIRMIEQPVFTPALISDIGNFLALCRRTRQRFRAAENPLNKETVTTAQYNRYFKFSFVRNPWARAFSWYKGVMRDDIMKKNLGVTSDISFKEFLQQFAGKGMLKPQTYWLRNFKGTIDLDFLGRFENLGNDFQKVCNALNISDITLPHRLGGSKKDYRDSYDAESKEMIKRVYADEIEMFNYSFESD